MLHRIILFTLALILLIPAYAFCWTSTELFILEYGPEKDQIKITGEDIFDPGTPEDPTDDFVQSSSYGPSKVAVDNEENIVLLGWFHSELKGFSNEGQLLFDFSKDSPDYNPEFYSGQPKQVFVDDEFNLYLCSGPGMGYVPVMNYQGEIIEKIRPFTQNPDAQVHYVNRVPDGTMFFLNRFLRWVTYENGESSSGGTSSFKANNGSFYSVKKETATSLEFKTFENPDLNGVAETRDSTIIEIDVDSLLAAGIIMGGDGNSLYATLVVNDHYNYEIWQFDMEYNFIDKLVLGYKSAYEDLRLMPFVRSDGSIYEFLFREDGLHVIRWSRE